MARAIPYAMVSPTAPSAIIQAASTASPASASTATLYKKGVPTAMTLAKTNIERAKTTRRFTHGLSSGHRYGATRRMTDKPDAENSDAGWGS